MANPVCVSLARLSRAWPLALIWSALSSNLALAQAAPSSEPPPAAATQPAPPLVVPPPPPPPAAPPVLDASPVVATEAAAGEPLPAPALPPPAPPEDPKKFPLTLSAWMHMSNRLQNLNEPKKLNRFSQENELNLLLKGQIVKQHGFTASMVAGYGPTSPTSGTMNGNVALLDLIGKLDLSEGFHLWVGRMLVPSDRSNFSGTWFMAPWYYPGRYYSGVSKDNAFFAAPVGPRQGFNGRNDGATIWGEWAGGMLKYYASAFDLHSSDNNPLLSGRINLALINPEPGYYHSSTYYGSKDILALAIGGQFQKTKGTGTDYSEFNADLLFEKNLGGAGVIDIEGAFYKYYGSSIDLSYFLVLSYLTPQKLGPGYLQPLVRLQQAKPAEGDTWTIFEGQLGYAIEAYAARLALGYQYTTAANTKSNALYLGLQLQK